MKIRSITCFLNPSNPIDLQKLAKAGELLQIAGPKFAHTGYEVQSARLAVVPFTFLLAEYKPDMLAQISRQLEVEGANLGYAYVSLGPALPEKMESYACIPEALAATRNAFFSGSLTTQDGKVSLQAVRGCAQVIQKCANISPDGFGNLRFAALANVSAGSPFFPAAYHKGGEPSFALATEAADLAVSAFSRSSSLEEARAELVRLVEGHAHALTQVARQVELETGVKFGGIDFSLAPFPDDEHSIGSAMQRMGVPVFGDYGTLATAAILADTLDQAQFQRAGFCGLMLPVLEDATLAKRAAQGRLTIKDLLLFSAVCGTGLDCIPLPGDTTVDQIAAVLLDLASLSTRLNKPLTARLMPIPGKKAGDMTAFNFGYFVNSRVMALTADTLKGVLAGEEEFSLHPRVVE